MTPEQQRIAIAEACGWESIGENHSSRLCGFHLKHGADGVNHYVPDYLNDLDAMHEAEKVLNDEAHGRFRAVLAAVVTGRSDTATRLMSKQEYRKWFSAIASQRAEAFLRTLNKWED